METFCTWSISDIIMSNEKLCTWWLWIMGNCVTCLSSELLWIMKSSSHYLMEILAELILKTVYFQWVQIPYSTHPKYPARGISPLRTVVVFVMPMQMSFLFSIWLIHISKSYKWNKITDFFLISIWIQICIFRNKITSFLFFTFESILKIYYGVWLTEYLVYKLCA
jgi:hypothetical protein